MAAYGREGVLCVDVVVRCCRMPVVVVSRVALCHAREEAFFNMRRQYKSSYGGESMKHTLAVASSQRQPTANDVARPW